MKSSNNQQMVQIVKGAKEQQNNEAIPRTALPRLAVKNYFLGEEGVASS